ncbi:hypothetical protein SGGMMB4_02793 [Sodalis glossinidius str. 'morsitans']|uniref:Hypothetical phage protein n=1 Tax=Sodalis glossinidius (strain morsitans) TaxID=343509 RepID=Q2NTL8_SODGM|nr:DUF1441 family protein [Sodalis glossinidius]BAE74507.1 hypothetical phage protein [Sodalis glossinidius str. 'morsitans']CRL45218.1 hypothetical protein SGGMMB4_02793 [Sodalis glossinidius str. 'morsitans']
MSNISNIGDVYQWSVAKIAEACRLDRRSVKNRLLEANIPIAGTVKGNPVYALHQVVPALFGQLNTGDTAANQNSDDMTPKERKDWFDSEKGRIWLEKEQRQLIPVHEVTAVYSALMKALVQVLETLPDVLERDAALTPSAVAVVQDAIDKAREGFGENAYTMCAAVHKPQEEPDEEQNE